MKKLVKTYEKVQEVKYFLKLALGRGIKFFLNFQTFSKYFQIFHNFSKISKFFIILKIFKIFHNIQKFQNFS